MNKDLLKYIGALLLFGSNGYWVAHIDLNSYEIVFMRGLIGGILLLALFFLTRQKSQAMQYKKDFAYLILAGLATGANWLSLFEAYRQVGVGTATLFCYCGPVIVIVLGAVLFHEKMTRNKWIGLFAVLLGVVCINGQNVQTGGGLWGSFCGVMAAVTFAVLMIANKKSARITGVERAVWQILFAFLVIFVFLLARGELPVSVPRSSLPYVVILASCTALACYLQLTAMGKLPVQTIAIWGYLEPFGALFCSVLLLGEAMGPLQAAGAALILGGAMFAELKGKTT